VLLDGEEIDRDPGARLASVAQRTALAFRKGGATVVKNMFLLCSEHHTLTHHEPGLPEAPLTLTFACARPQVNARSRRHVRHRSTYA
jgi:hypothetical protein